jgi:hypothetical protein
MAFRLVFVAVVAVAIDSGYQSETAGPTSPPAATSVEQATGVDSAQLLPGIGVARTCRWPLCTSYATMISVYLSAGRGEFTDAVRFADALARGERDGDLNDVLDNAQMYNLGNIMWATPCDPVGLPNNFGCLAPIDCALKFVGNPDLAGKGVALMPLVCGPVATSVDDCQLSDGYVATCDFNSGKASANFLATTDGRFFLLGYGGE